MISILGSKPGSETFGGEKVSYDSDRGIQMGVAQIHFQS